MATCKGDNIVQVIERTECIGNSLVKINSNFKGLDAATCELQTFVGEVVQVEGMLKCHDQHVMAGVPGTDYTAGTAGMIGLLKTDVAGTVSVAVSSVDYYVPRTALEAFNTTIFGTLSTTGTAWMDTIHAKGDVIAYSSSDERLKKDITTIPNALEKVTLIQGVEYDWDTELQNVFTGHDVGVIAQQIEKVLPAAVTDRENGYKAVNYAKIIPLLIEAIKELKQEIEVLKSK